MADDVIKPLNPPITPVQKEELEEPSLDVNISQRLRDKESFERMVRTQVDRFTWDRRLSANPHALVIYLEFIPAHGVVPKRFEECQCEHDYVRLHYRT
jgi:hypothetical protein